MKSSVWMSVYINKHAIPWQNCQNKGVQIKAFIKHGTVKAAGFGFQEFKI